MSTTYTNNLRLQKPANSDRGWDVPLLADLTYLDSIAALGQLAVVPTETPSTTLNVQVAAGKFRNDQGTMTSYAGTSSIAMTASSTNFVWLDNSGTLHIGTAYPASGPYVPLAIVAAGASTITGVTDDRPAYGTVGRGPTLGTAVLVAGTVTVSLATVTSSSLIFFSRKVTGGTTGMLTYAVTAGTSFTITSSSGTDTSTIAYSVMEP